MVRCTNGIKCIGGISEKKHPRMAERVKNKKFCETVLLTRLKVQIGERGPLEN